MSAPAAAAVPPRTLVVTNDFPPRVGGVQQYVWNLVSRLPPDRVAVLAPAWPGWREHDRAQPFAVHRWPSTLLLPTGDLGRRVRSLVREHSAEVVLFGHGYPLPALAPSLGRRDVPSVVMTHGAEVWMARTPALSAGFRTALAAAAEVTAVSEYTAGALRSSLPPGRAPTVLYPGVDESRFSPSVSGDQVRARFGVQGRPVVLCVSRLVPRKGQDVLIRAVADVRRLAPGAVVLVVGEGPYRERLERLAVDAPDGSVIMAGEVADADLPAHYAAADVFAMPCRSRWAGQEVEGFGIVFLEASATGVPVVAGRSGGAAEAVEDERTGLLVEGREPKAVALAVGRLLRERGVGEAMGRAGRERVESSFTWSGQARRLVDVLSRAVAGVGAAAAAAGGAFAASPLLTPTPSAGPTPGSAGGRPVGLPLVIGIGLLVLLVYSLRRRFERTRRIFDEGPEDEPHSDS
ncbi:MAG TPA: glycosyltransferase family 4 protein [Actinomycetota bacterium]